MISRRNFLSFSLSTILLERFSFSDALAAGADISHGSRDKKEVALTFHGAGDIKIADDILAITKEIRTPITVMAVGNWLSANPNIGKSILVDGHELGNHTYSHQAMLHLNLKQATNEIQRGKAALKNAVGSPQKYFRPSGTPKSNATIRKAALAAGYSNCITYDVDTLDYQDPKPTAIIKNCMTSVKNGSIISLHLGHRNTVTALPKLISELNAAGLKPVTVTNLLS